jgi:hypothetical protein
MEDYRRSKREIPYLSGRESHIEKLTSWISYVTISSQSNSPERHSYPERWRDRPYETSAT